MYCCKHGNFHVGINTPRESTWVNIQLKINSCTYHFLIKHSYYRKKVCLLFPIGYGVINNTWKQNLLLSVNLELKCKKWICFLCFLQVSIYLNWIVRNAAELELSMNSVERVDEFIHLEREVDFHHKGQGSCPTWWK